MPAQCGASRQRSTSRPGEPAWRSSAPGFGIDERLLPEVDWLREYGITSPVIDGDVLAVVGSLPNAERRTPNAEGIPQHRGDPGGRSTPDSGLPTPVGGTRTELLRVLGVDILRDFPVRDYQVGDAGPLAPPPQTATDILGLLTDPSAAVISRAFADRHGLKVGDPLRIIISDRPLALRVGALLEAEGPARLLDGNFLLMDLAAAQWAFERLGQVDRIDVKLHDGVDIAGAERAIALRLPKGLAVQRPARRGQQVEQMLAAFHLNLTALSSIALLVGLFLVYNAVSVSVLARRQEIGTLRALGVTRRQVQGLFLGEAAVFGVLGVALGIPLARLLADVTVSLTSRTVNTLYVAAAAAPPTLTWFDLLLAVLVGVPLSLLAAWLPAQGSGVGATDGGPAGCRSSAGPHIPSGTHAAGRCRVPGARGRAEPDAADCRTAARGLSGQCCPRLRCCVAHADAAATGRRGTGAPSGTGCSASVVGLPTRPWVGRSAASRSASRLWPSASR